MLVLLVMFFKRDNEFTLLTFVAKNTMCAGKLLRIYRM